jgi:hypothetical protein
MFSPIEHWRLPDTTLVLAGCFSIRMNGHAASVSHDQTFQRRPTKRSSKHSLLKQRRAGYRPSALTRIVDDSGRTDGAVLKTIPLRRRGVRLIAHDAWRQEEKFRRSTADRSPALATEKGAGGDQRSTLNTAWDSRKACHTSWAERRRLSPRQAGLPTGAALVPRDLCFAKPPPVAAPTIVEPATLARTTQAVWPERPRSGTTPRREAVDECVSTHQLFNSRSAHSCRRHDKQFIDLVDLGRFPPMWNVKHSFSGVSERLTSSGIVVQFELRDLRVHLGARNSFAQGD